LAQRFHPDFFFFEVFAASAAEKRSALLLHSAYVARAKRDKVAVDKSEIALSDADDFPSLIQRGPSDGANGGVHSRRISAARQYRNLSHKSSALPEENNREVQE
jgi:hypothetical protein